MRVLKPAAFALLLSIGLILPRSVLAWPDHPNAAWEDLRAAAIAEGGVILFGSGEFQGAFLEAFTADTGIPISHILSTRSEGRARFRREVQARRATFDVAMSGRSSYVFIDDGLLTPIAENLVLPEVTEGANWRGGRLRYADDEGAYLPVPAHYASGFVVLNSDLVDPATLTTWDDLLSPELTGRIASHDPTIRGAGMSVGMYLAEVKGEDYLRKLFTEQVGQWTSDYRQVVDWAARGTYPVVLGARAVDVLRYREAGLDNIVVLRMTDHPGYLAGGNSVPQIPSSAPHPKAAIAFVNWYLSAAGQRAYTEAYALPSDRIDITQGRWPDFLEWAAEAGYVDQYTEEWSETVAVEMGEILQRALGR